MLSAEQGPLGIIMILRSKDAICLLKYQGIAGTGTELHAGRFVQACIVLMVMERDGRGFAKSRFVLTSMLGVEHQSPEETRLR